MEYLTAREAAQRTGLSERTIRRKVEAGQLPARRLARNRLAIPAGELPRLARTPAQARAAAASLELAELRERCARLEWRTGELERQVRELLAARPTAPARPRASVRDERFRVAVGVGILDPARLAGEDS